MATNSTNTTTCLLLLLPIIIIIIIVYQKKLNRAIAVAQKGQRRHTRRNTVDTIYMKVLN